MVTAVTPLPTLSRSDPDFKAKVNALFMTQLPAWTVASNAQALEVNGLATMAETYKNAASASASVASGHVAAAAAQAALALGYADLAAQYAGAAPHVPGTSYALGSVVWSNIDRQLYRRQIAGSGAADPKIDTANWSPLGQNIAVAMGASSTIDCSAGNYFYKTMTANLTLLMGNVPSAPVRYGCFLEVAHTAGVLTLPAGSYWANGVAPNFSTGKVHLLFASTRNGGSTWRWSAQPNFGG